MNRQRIILALLILCAPGLYAQGSRDIQDSVRLFAVHPGEAGSDGLFVQRFLIPASLTTLYWTPFDLIDGEVRTETMESVQIRDRKTGFSRRVGEFVVEAFDLDVMPKPPHRRDEDLSFLVNIDYEGTSFPVQPYRLALQEAIRLSGFAEGTARVVSMKYLGLGRFQAEVHFKG